MWLVQRALKPVACSMTFRASRSAIVFLSTPNSLADHRRWPFDGWWSCAQPHGGADHLHLARPRMLMGCEDAHVLDLRIADHGEPTLKRFSKPTLASTSGPRGVGGFLGPIVFRAEGGLVANRIAGR
jgi:hypothetical protein